MSRSIWKPFFLTASLPKISKKKTLYIWSRQGVIPISLIGLTVFVHNGKIFKKLRITREKIGFKFGVFIKTRTKPITKKLKIKKK